MAKTSNQKLKLLYLKKMLLEKTDESNTVTIKDMISYLASQGISAERKSIYDDLESLKHYGLDIMSKKTKTTEYYIGNRDFELPELKLLVDAVQCSKFITTKKTKHLIKKIENLTSTHQAKQLQRQVFIKNRIKNLNEDIYYTIDTIHSGISQKQKISFKYFDYGVDKKKTYRKNGKFYEENPHAMLWNDEKYYLIAYNSKHNSFTHYRVDKMSNVELLPQKQDSIPKEKKIDLSNYTKNHFNMYSGEEKQVQIKCCNELADIIVDRFGNKVKLSKFDENHFVITENIVVSKNFFSWLFRFGAKIKLISPEETVLEYKDYLNEVINSYNI